MLFSYLNGWTTLNKYLKWEKHTILCVHNFLLKTNYYKSVQLERSLAITLSGQTASAVHSTVQQLALVDIAIGEIVASSAAHLARSPFASLF